MGIKRDWRNPKDYEFTKQLSKDGWQWEFFRRNPKYIDEWKKALANYKIEQKKSRDDLIPIIKTLFDKGEDSKEKIPSRISSEGASSRWGFCFDEIINPEIDNPQEDPDIPIFKTFDYYYSKESLNLLPDLTEHKVVVVFDLSKSLTPQWKNIQPLLKEEQNDLKNSGKIEIQNIRNHLDIWISYLRILDAKKENVKDVEIAQVIFPKDDHTVNLEYLGNRLLKDRYKSAKKFVNDREYRKIF
jgi:hypothetical protein